MQQILGKTQTTSLADLRCGLGKQRLSCGRGKRVHVHRELSRAEQVCWLVPWVSHTGLCFVEACLWIVGAVSQGVEKEKGWFAIPPMTHHHQQ